MVGICAFGGQIANVGLNYLLIFGIIRGLAPLGRKGAALDTLFFLRRLCLVLWIFFFFLEGLNLIAFGLLSGLGLTWFRLKVSAISSGPIAYFLFYLAFCHWQLNPDKIWMMRWISRVFLPIALIKAKSHIRKLSNSLSRGIQLFRLKLGLYSRSHLV